MMGSVSKIVVQLKVSKAGISFLNFLQGKKVTNAHLC